MTRSSDPEGKMKEARWERDLMQAALLLGENGFGDRWEVPWRHFDAVNAEREAQAEFRKAGIAWPCNCPHFWQKAHGGTVFSRELIAFARERWGEGLLIVLSKRRFGMTQLWDRLESHTIRRLLLILDEGVRQRLPKFESVAKRVAALFGPLPGRGNRTKVSVADVEKRRHAAILWPRFREIFRWLDSDMPEETEYEKLLARLRDNRPYLSAIARVDHLAELKIVPEPKMLRFVAEATAEHHCSDGQRAASAIRKGFTRFCKQLGLAPRSASPASFVNGVQKWIRLRRREMHARRK